MPEPSVAYLRLMVEAKMSQAAIGKRCQIGIKRVRALMEQHGLQSLARPGVVAQPKDDIGPIHGTSGKKPPKLMPSTDALKAVSVFHLGA